MKNGCVIDGVGNPWFKTDVGVAEGKIRKMGDLRDVSAETIIDAKGLVVSPGFFDMHSHSDFTLLVNPKAESKVRQGITTDVNGHCGQSAAPIAREEHREMIKETLGYLSAPEVKWNWTTFADHLSRLEEGVAINVATFVGHSTIRMGVMGFDNRPPNIEELQEMKESVAQSMKEGAFGLTTMLGHPVGCYAKEEEIVELFKVAAKYGGIYTTHLRSQEDQLEEAVKEAIRIGEAASAPVVLSHHKPLGRANWGKTKITLRLVDEARNRGLDIGCDQYPYNETLILFRQNCIPPWAMEGGIESMIKRLKDPKTREKIKNEFYVWGAEWNEITISTCNRAKEFEGRTIAEIAKSKNVDPAEFILDLIMQEPDTWASAYLISDEDLIRVMKHPTFTVGSDGVALAPYGPLGGGMPHPVSYGTFPRFLRYVREKQVMTLEEAVRKMTSLPAQRLGLWDRGIIRPEMWADLVIFDRDRVTDQATFQHPHQYPLGIEYVVVNGQVVIARGEHTGKLPGKIIRHTPPTS
ncbi:MAG: amidohydrolase family protein [Candidatus Bathyarchaeia archaeon]